MSNQLEIRIVKESIVSEFQWMSTPEKNPYFSQVADNLLNDRNCSRIQSSMSLRDYGRFLRTINRFDDPALPYYHQSALFLKEILNANEVRIWTKKESLELREVLTESFWDKTVSELFLPVFTSLAQNELLLFIIINQG